MSRDEPDQGYPLLEPSSEPTSREASASGVDPRAAADQNAAAARRAKLDPERTVYRRDHFTVFDEDGFLTSFSARPPASATVESVVVVLSRDFRGTNGAGYDGLDMAVWNDGRIVAVIRAGADGEPVGTIFGVS
jgi:hypothetical protein